MAKRNKKNQDIAKTSPNPVLVLWDLRSEVITLFIAGRGDEQTENQLTFLALSEIPIYVVNCQPDIKRDPSKDREFSQDETMPSENHQCNKEAGAS